MARVKNNDHRAFSELYERYASRLHGYFYKMLWSDKERAEDAVHDLFAKIIDRPELFKEGNAFKSWIFQIAHNMCKNIYRKISFENEYRKQLENEGIVFSKAERKIDEEIQFEQIQILLKDLNEEDRSLFVMRYQQELSIEDLSQLFEIPEGTVKSRLFKIRKILSQKMGVKN